MKSPVNSNEDDIKIEWLNNQKGLVMRKDVYGNTSLYEFIKLKERKYLDFDIQIVDLSENE